MKTLKALFALPCLLAAQLTFAQNASHLTLSDQYPAAGEKITFKYDPSGTPVDGLKDITATVYYLDNKDFPAADVDLKADGALLTGDISIPEAAKAFFIKVSSGDSIDNNNGKGYVYMIYKDKKPVPGAYFYEGYLVATGMGTHFAKIKKDDITAMELMKKEFELYPQSKKDYDANYYSVLARTPANKPMVIAKIGSLEKSSDEKDLMLAASLLRMTNNSKGYDSLNAVIRTKFPDGVQVKNDMTNAFYKEKDVVKKDSIYNAYIKKYPEDPKEKNSMQDNFRVQLASVYLAKGDMDNFHKYERLVKNKTYLANDYNNTAYEWAKAGEHLDDAEKMARQALDIEQEAINNAVGIPYYTAAEVKKGSQSSYDMDADTYAYVLFKDGKFDEALKYEQPVIDHMKYVDPDIYGNYIQILVAENQNDKAKEYAEKAILDGKGSAGIKENLKKGYIKLKGSDTGFDQYVANLETESKDKTRVALLKEMINQPSPAFTLKDLDGNVVSLADLKGKVVIVDFWATWCGPCKASFPGMQMAVTKYKDNPNVKFLFVDCWETDQDYTNGVKKFIADNKYSFHVLLDEKVASGKQEKVVSTFGVEGIPTKFVIDKDGNIRFKRVGFLGSTEALAEEVSEMIDIVGNPDGIASGTTANPAKTGSGK